VLFGYLSFIAEMSGLASLVAALLTLYSNSLTCIVWLYRFFIYRNVMTVHMGHGDFHWHGSGELALGRLEFTSTGQRLHAS
jgi:hypothetical protein